MEGVQGKGGIEGWRRRGGGGGAGFDGLGLGTQIATQGGTAGGTGEEASLGASGSSGAGKRTDLSGRDNKNHEQHSYYKSIKVQSLEFIIVAALVFGTPPPNNE